MSENKLSQVRTASKS